MSTTNVRAPILSSSEHPYWKWNLTLYLMEVTFFLVGYACVDPSTVLPTFLDSLTGSRIAVGAVMATRSFASLVPQLLVARVIAHRSHLKPILVLSASVGRLPFVFFALWLMFGSAGPQSILYTFIPVYGTFLVFDACSWVPWASILSRTVPPRTRSWFFALMQLIAGVLSLLSGRFVHWSLQNLPFPRQFGVLYGAAALGMLMSAACLALLKEPPREDTDDAPPPVRVYLSQIAALWHSDQGFRSLLLTLAFIAFFNLASTFYVLDAQETTGAPKAMVGTYVSSAMIGSALGGVLFNLVRERFGSKRALQAMVVSVVVVPATALVVRQISASAYIVTFVLSGIVGWSSWTVAMNYFFDWRGDSRRSLMEIGVMNAVSAVGLFLPAIGGYVVEFAGYPTLFCVTLVASVPAIWASARLPRV